MLSDFYKLIRSRWAVQSARESVPAVDTDGLASLLDEAGVRRKFERGDMNCKFCRTPVNEATVYAVIKDSGSVKVVCSSPACVSRLVEWIESR